MITLSVLQGFRHCRNLIGVELPGSFYKRGSKARFILLAGLCGWLDCGKLRRSQLPSGPERPDNTEPLRQQALMRGITQSSGEHTPLCRRVLLSLKSRNHNFTVSWLKTFLRKCNLPKFKWCNYFSLLWSYNILMLLFWHLVLHNYFF